MSTIDDLKKVRRHKLNTINKVVGLAYPAKTKRTHAIGEALDNFTKLSKSEKEVVLVGRIMAMRGHGGATFLDIQDGTGKLQGLVKEEKIGEKGYKFFEAVFDI